MSYPMIRKLLDRQEEEFRAGIQRSMAEPYRGLDKGTKDYTGYVGKTSDGKFVALNRRQVKSYIPLPRVERRRRHLTRFWFNYNHAIGFVCWSMVFVLVAAEGILIYGIR